MEFEAGTPALQLLAVNQSLLVVPFQVLTTGTCARASCPAIIPSPSHNNAPSRAARHNFGHPPLS